MLKRSRDSRNHSSGSPDSTMLATRLQVTASVSTWPASRPWAAMASYNSAGILCR